MAAEGQHALSQPLAVAVLVCAILFPLAHWLWRSTRSPVKKVSTGEAVVMVITGSGAPQAACLVLWPIWPEMLTAVTDIPLLLLPTGVISLLVSIGSIFDWK